MNYYERHIGDYLKDTAHLSLLEHGVYTRLMDVYYTREGSIPAAEAARLVGARSKDEREALAAVLAEFFVLADGAHQQDRCEREIARFQDKQAKAKRSAEVRWGARQSHSEGNASAGADAMRTHCEGNAPRARPQTPVTSNQPSSKAAGSRGTRLPADWALPRAWGEWALADSPEWTDETVRRVADGFRDHWTAKSGKDATKVDWLATWRTWCRSEITQRQFPPSARSAAPKSAFIADRKAQADAWMGTAAPRTGTPETIDLEAANHGHGLAIR